MTMIYANVHKLSSGRICLSINSLEDDCHANMTLFDITPDTLRGWADQLEATIKAKQVEDRVRAAIEAEV